MEINADTSSQKAEYALHVFGKSDENWVLRIGSNAIELTDSSGIEKIQFSREEAQKSVRLNTVQMGGSTFSAKIPKQTLFRCSSEAYRHLETWFGREALIRMEFRSPYPVGLLLGILLMYNAFTASQSFGFSLWVFVTAAIGAGLLIVALLPRIAPSLRTLVAYTIIWLLLAVRSIYALSYGVNWFHVVLLLLSGWSVYWYYHRYSRLSRVTQNG